MGFHPGKNRLSWLISGATCGRYVYLLSVSQALGIISDIYSFINAFSNIARHTGARDPVRVHLEQLGDSAVLKVEDGGPGMPEVTYGVRPEQFQRFDPSRSRTSGGSGLGMSIMADIATSMGGVLTTSKSDLGGLALTFIFPVAAPPR